MSNKNKHVPPFALKAWRGLLAASLVIAPASYPAAFVHADLSPHPVHDIVALPGEHMKLQLKDLFDGNSGVFQLSGTEDDEQVVSVNLDTHDLQLFFRQPGQATFTVTLNGDSRQVAVNVLEAANEGPMDIGDLVRFINANPEKFTDRSSVSTYLQTVAPGEVQMNHAPTVSQATYSLRYTSGYTLDMSAFFNDSDGDTLDYVVLPASMNGIEASLSGSVLTLTGTQTAKSAFTVYAMDPKGAFASIKLLPNTPPAPLSVTGSVYAAVYEQPQAISLSPYFIDMEGDELSYRVAGVTVTDYTYNGQLTPLVPFINPGESILRFSGQLAARTDISIIAGDGQYESEPFRLTLDPSPSAYNRPPVGTPLSLSAYKNSLLSSVTLSTYFHDPDGDPLTYSVSPSTSGNVTASIANGILSFSGKIKANATFTVVATDSHGASTSAAFTYTLDNRAPTGSPVTAVVYKNTELSSIALASHFTDPDGDWLTYTVSPPTSGGVTASITSGVLSFSGQLAANASFIVTAKDAQGAQGSAAFTYVLENRPPAGTPFTVQVPLYTTPDSVTLATYFSDPDGDALSYTVTPGAPESQNGLAASIIDGILSFSGAITGPSEFVVRAYDGGGLFGEAVFAYDIANSAPIAAEPVVSLNVHNEVPPIDLSANFSDPDLDELTFTVDPLEAAKLPASIENGYLLIDGMPEDIVSFTVTAMDPSGASASAVYQLTPSNTPPIAEPHTVTGARYHAPDPIDLTEFFQDDDGDKLTFSLTSTEESGGLNAYIEGNHLNFSGAQTATAVFTVTGTDQMGGTISAMFTIELINQAPTGSSRNETVFKNDELVSLSLDDYFTDPDGDELTYTVSPDEAGGITASIESGVLYLSGLIQSDASFTVTATDIGGAEATATFSYLLANRKPEVVQVPDAISTPRNGALTSIDLSAYFSDPDGDELYFEVLPNEEVNGITAQINGGVMSFIGSITETTTFTVRAYDHSEAYEELEFTFLIVNQAPIAGETLITLQAHNEVGAIHLPSNFSDPDGDKLIFTVDPAVTGDLTTSIQSGNLYITGVPKEQASFTVTATDERGESAWAVYTIVPVNQAPTGSPVTIAGTWNETPATVDLNDYFQDSDEDELLFSIAEPTTSGGLTAYLEGGHMLSFTGNQTAEARFEITAADIMGGYETITYTIELHNLPPVGEVLYLDVGRNSYAAPISLAELFVDPENDPLTFEVETLSSGNVHASISGNLLMFEGQIEADASFRVTATEYRYDQAAPLSATADIHLRAVNSAPETASPVITDYYHYLYGEAYIYPAVTLAHLFLDPNGDPLTFSLKDGANSGLSEVTVNGVKATIMPDNEKIMLYFGGNPTNVDEAIEFTVVAADGQGAETPLTYRLAFNHAPELVDPEGGSEGLAYVYIDHTGTIEDLDLNTLVDDPDGDPLAFTYYEDDSYTDGLSVTLSGSTLSFEGRLNRETPEPELALHLQADDGKNGRIDFVLLARYRSIPVASEPEVRVSYLKEQPAGALALSSVYNRFYATDGNELFYEIYEPEGEPLPDGYHAELAYPDGLLHVQLSKDSSVEVETPYVPVRVRAHGAHGFAEIVYVFQLNQAPASLLPSNVDIYPEIGILNQREFFMDPDGGDSFTVEMSITDRGYDGQNYWLGITGGSYELIGLNPYLEDGLNGIISFTATDNHTQSSQQTVEFHKTAASEVIQMPDKRLSAGTELTLKDLSTRYSLDTIHKFKASSDDPEGMLVSISNDGQDLTLAAEHAGTYRITLIGTAADDTGFIDQFYVTVTEPEIFGSSLTISNPFGTEAIVNRDSVESENANFAAVLEDEADPDLLQLQVSVDEGAAFLENTYFILYSNGAIYKIRFYSNTTA
ncbi:hypothetical protein SAMN02799630_00154 [Paenibacillus sp. UNCCL117]|uniref:Ig-like domain-containing protein n=1 Tax=unclassified Paenibacillus TaxID=185978 RepID=UPI000881CF8F|nr:MULTISPECIES: hypothetical protein [unclassified Paenibacillus]SDC50660.1 hypothetical protein SAMN04488602_102378 [Paenibacillus sp. cl123]SFW11577.1 hypothetical protein SAMN02799630_00154 [Paenibacillus sp. UNCCL117]